MPQGTRPRVHARDHEHGGADVTRIHYEDVGDEGGGGDGGGGAALFSYAAGTSHHLDVTTGFSGYLSFGTTHSSGVTISGTTITIVTSGVYQVLASGWVAVSGASSTTPQVEMLLEVNGTGGDVGGYAASLRIEPGGGTWTIPMTVLDQLALTAGDVLKFQGSNYTDVTVQFGRWRVVVLRLA